MEEQNKTRPRRPHRDGPDDRDFSKIDKVLIDVQRKLQGSVVAAELDNLSAFERKRVHSFFDNKSDFKTKTYRNGEQYVLKVFPIGNLCRAADEKVNQVLESGESYMWENLCNFERFIIHNHLKDYESVETASIGEGQERKLEIKSKPFGRSLKKIIRKIRLF